MPAEVKKEIQLEIAHVLFTDIVGYSKLSINEQRALVERLNEIVRRTDGYQAAETAGRLIKIPTGDGITLVFYQSPEAPVECALEISRALKKYPELQLRMGIHSGPVSGVIDVTGKANVAGAGINMAQRVMGCGDAGHILLSKHVAEDLEQYPHWQPYLHELGECEVKHGLRVSVVNLCTDELGNPAVPEKLKVARLAAAAKRKRVAFRRLSLAALTLLVAAAAIGFLFFRYAQRFAGTTSAVLEKSIAVLPFENLSAEKENAYFTDGVQNEILSDLAKIADLKVISRTSVMLYKAGNPRNLREIGQQLGVAHVLEGSVQRTAGKLRVNAQLIDARTDKHLWAKTYDRDLADVFTIETELAQLIANELEAKLSPRERASIEEKPTQNLAAYDLYLRAKPLIDGAPGSANKEKDLSQAVDLLNRAIDLDPAFVLAYCQLAETHDAFYFQRVDHTPGRLALAKAAIDSAFRLKPDSGEGHLALALHLYWGYYDYEHARDELALAARTLPNNARLFQLTGYIDRRQGRWLDAVRNFKRASELDPRNVEHIRALAATYYLLREYRQLENTLDRIQALEPTVPRSQLFRAWISVDERADTRPVHATIDKILADDPAQAESEDLKQMRSSLAWCERDFTAAERALAILTQERNTIIARGGEVEFSRAFAEGVIARTRGDVAAAQANFTAARAQQEELVRAHPDHAGGICALGLIDAGLGRKEEALREGRQAVEMLPVAKNALDGPEILYFFAVICAWIGEHDLAIEQLDTLVKIPVGPTYGELRLDPFWDPVRGDPRFEKIVASLAPK
jgi:TolB-like protein/class 3 adenylate cyclase/Tfp pilus assembly protein PilF